MAEMSSAVPTWITLAGQAASQAVRLPRRLSSASLWMHSLHRWRLYARRELYLDVRVGDIDENGRSSTRLGPAIGHEPDVLGQNRTREVRDGCIEVHALFQKALWISPQAFSKQSMEVAQHGLESAARRGQGRRQPGRAGRWRHPGEPHPRRRGGSTIAGRPPRKSQIHRGSEWPRR